VAKRSPTAERDANLIRTALFEVAPAGMTLVRLMGSCELSRWQTRRGLATLRDPCAERGWPPVIWTRDLGYYFCASEARASNPSGTPVMCMRDRLDEVFVDGDFTDWFPADGRRGLSPAMLAMVPVLQYAENGWTGS
jgi:hypothetical protein